MEEKITKMEKKMRIIKSEDDNKSWGEALKIEKVGLKYWEEIAGSEQIYQKIERKNGRNKTEYRRGC